MKRILLIILIVAYSVNMYSQQEVLTNQSIIDMVEMGFDEELILTKIRTSVSNFSTDIADLKALKEKGISNEVIKAIMHTGKEASDAVMEANNNMMGIYYMKDGELVKILPTVFSGTKTNTLATAFTYGLANTTIKSTMNRAHSTNIVEPGKDEFYFYFRRTNTDDPISNWWFATASSPNEFVLVELKVRESKNRREISTGKVNLVAGSSIGIDERDAIPFGIEQLDEYSFKVKPTQPLPLGEYCFFYQGMVPQGGYTNQSVFDFSINNHSKYHEEDEIYYITDKGKIKPLIITKVYVKDGENYYDGVNPNGFGGSKKGLLESECYSSRKEAEKVLEKNK